MHHFCSQRCENSQRVPAWAQFLSSQINKAKNEKVENLNKIFTEVQRDVKSVSKPVAPEPKKQMQVYSLNIG